MWEGDIGTGLKVRRSQSCKIWGKHSRKMDENMPKEEELAGVVSFPKTRSEIIMPDVLTTLKLFVRRNVQTLKKVET